MCRRYTDVAKALKLLCSLREYLIPTPTDVWSFTFWNCQKLSNANYRYSVHRQNTDSLLGITTAAVLRSLLPDFLNLEGQRAVSM